MSKIVEIIEGWANVVKDQFNAVDPVTKEVSKKRLLECNSCDIRNGNICSPNRWGINILTEQRVNGCGCNIAAKTLSPSSQCPLGKW
jgi:hypothetical protein